MCGRRRRMGDLDEDLLVEVLVRLPCRNVMRLKLVCKRWMSLISNSMFIRYYHTLNPMKQHHHWSLIVLAPWSGVKEVRFLGGCGHKNFFKPGLSFLPQPNQKTLFVVGSFNDLLLCCSSGSTSSRGVHYYICNPVTMQFVALPPPPSSSVVCVGFVCEPFKNRDGDLNYDYRCRVVRHITGTLELEIFSSETGLWTKNNLANLSSSCSPSLSRGRPRKLVPFQNGQMMLFMGDIAAIKFDAFAGGQNIKGHLVSLPQRFYDHNTHVWSNSAMTSQGRLFLVEVLLHGSPLSNPCYLKVLEYYSDEEDSSSGKWKLIHHIRFSEMRVIPCCNDDELDLPAWKLSNASPHDKQQRRTWLGNFIKYFVWGGAGCWVGCVGFHLTRPDLMYLILCPPHPIFPTLATYNMQTRAIQLVPKNRVPPHLRCLHHPFASHHIFPFVKQPWPTPLPTLPSFTI